MANEPNDLEVAFAESEVARAAEAGLPVVVDAHAVVVREDALPAELFPRDPVKALTQMQALVSMMHGAMKASGESRFIARIPGQPNPYPMVTWWTTIALPLQLLPQIRWSRRIDTSEDSGYTKETWQSRCEVVHTPSGNVVASGEGLCSDEETRWDRKEQTRVPRWTDSHAIMAMSQTRAIGRTFRQCLAGLAVMAGLEATPYEEMTDKMRKDDQGQTAASDSEQTGEAASIRGAIGGWMLKVRNERDAGKRGTRREFTVKGQPANYIFVTYSKFEKYVVGGKNDHKNAGEGRPFTCEVTEGKCVGDEVHFLTQSLRHPAASDAIPVPGFEWQEAPAPEPEPPPPSPPDPPPKVAKATPSAQAVKDDPEAELTFWRLQVRGLVKKVPPKWQGEIPADWESWTSAGELERLAGKLADYTADAEAPDDGPHGLPDDDPGSTPDVPF